MRFKSAFFIVFAVILLSPNLSSTEPSDPQNNVAHNTDGLFFWALKATGSFIKRFVIATAEFLSTTAELGVHHTVRFFRATKQMISSAAERFWNPPPRPVRATDEQLTLAVEHMQQVARLTAGISLQTALIDEKQTTDELISELLHFGSVTPSQMTSIDSNRLRNTLKSLKELPNAMVDSTEVKEVEKKLELTEELRKLVQVAGDGSKWDGKDEFMQEMDNIEKKGVNVTQFSKMQKIMGFWQGNFDRVKDTDLATDDYSNKIKELKKSTESIFNLTKEWDHSTMNELKYPTIESAEKSLSSLSTLVEAVQKASDIKGNITYSPPSEESDFVTSKENIELLSTLSASLSFVLPDLQTIESILRERESPVLRSLKYPGFANGFHDLETLFDDFSGEWLQKVVDKERMVAALRPIKTLIPAFKRADKAFESFGSKDFKSLSNLLQPVNEVRTVSTDSNSTTTALGDMWKCKASFNLLDKPSADSLQQLISMARKLDVQFGQMRASIDEFVKAWNKQETINLLNDVNGLFVLGDDAVLNNTIKTLRASQSMKKLNDVIELAVKVFGPVPISVDKIKEQAANVAKNSTVVDDYIKSLSKFQPLLKCLHNIGQNRADLVTSGIAISRKFRTAKGNLQVVESGETVVDGVLKAADTFSSLNYVIGKTKGTNSQESDVLRILPDPEIHSGVLGSATRGISAMKLSLDQRAKADLIINNAGVVEAQLASASLDQEDKKNLDAVVELKGMLTTMYQQLDDWRNQDLNESSTVLESYSTLFTSAQNVAGVGVNLWNMSSSVEKLYAHANDPTARKQLQEVQKALVTLASIGIDFVSYTSSFAGSKDTLTALDTFFVNQRVKTTTVAPSPVTVPLVALQKIQFTQQPTIETTTFAYLSFIPFWVWVILAVVVIIALLAICVCIGWFAFVLAKKYMKPPIPPDVISVSDNEETDTARVPAPATNSKDKNEHPAKATMTSTGGTGDDSRKGEKTALAPSNNDALPVEKLIFIQMRKKQLPIFLENIKLQFTKNIGNQLGAAMEENKTAESTEKQKNMEKYRIIISSALNTATNESQNPEKQEGPEFRRCRSHPFNIQLGSSYRPLKNWKKYFTHDFYHANHLTLPNRQVYILMQSPHMADGIDNVEEFWYKLITEGVKIMFSCVHSNEINKPALCAMYFKPLSDGGSFNHNRVSVRCTYEEYDSTYTLTTKYKLEVEFEGLTKKGEPHKVVLYSFTGWEKGLVPLTSTVFQYILPKLFSQHPVVIHSPHGCGRAGTVAFMELSRQLAARNGTFLVSENLKAVRSARAGSVETEEQLAYAYAEVMTFPSTEICDAEQKEFIDSIIHIYYDMRDVIMEGRFERSNRQIADAAAKKNETAKKNDDEDDDLGDDDINPAAQFQNNLTANKHGASGAGTGDVPTGSGTSSGALPTVSGVAPTGSGTSPGALPTVSGAAPTGNEAFSGAVPATSGAASTGNETTSGAVPATSGAASTGNETTSGAVPATSGAAPTGNETTSGAVPATSGAASTGNETTSGAVPTTSGAAPTGNETSSGAGAAASGVGSTENRAPSNSSPAVSDGTSAGVVPTATLFDLLDYKHMNILRPTGSAMDRSQRGVNSSKSKKSSKSGKSKKSSKSSKNSEQSSKTATSGPSSQSRQSGQSSKNKKIGQSSKSKKSGMNNKSTEDKKNGSSKNDGKSNESQNGQDIKGMEEGQKNGQTRPAASGDQEKSCCTIL